MYYNVCRNGHSIPKILRTILMIIHNLGLSFWEGMCYNTVMNTELVRRIHEKYPFLA